jgi:hypothetical protein
MNGARFVLLEPGTALQNPSLRRRPLTARAAA